MNQIAGLLGFGLMVGSLSLIINIFVSIFNMICLFKIFDKSGETYWKALIPFYNVATLAKISDLNPYFAFFAALLYGATNFMNTSSLLYFIFNLFYLVFSIILTINLAKKFDFSKVAAIILTFLSPTIFYAILAFGPFNYIGNKKQINKFNHAFNLNGNSKDYEPQSDFFKD